MNSTVPGLPKRRVRIQLNLNDGLWQLFARTDHILTKLRQKELRQYGVNMNEAVVLLTVLRLKKLATAANISRQLFWEPHTVSEQLKSMEKKGLIRKLRDLDRKNMIRVEATEKGLEAYRQSARRKSTREIMSVLTEDEQLQLWLLLAKIREKGMAKIDSRLVDPFPPSDPNRLRSPR